jgi:flagellar hook-length control protein FliK
MPQPTPISVANPAYLEGSKALLRSDAPANDNPWRTPSQDFGQLFARVHAASKGQTFAASAAAFASQTSPSSLPLELASASRASDAMAQRTPRFERPAPLREDTRVTGRTDAADQGQRAQRPQSNRDMRRDTPSDRLGAGANNPGVAQATARAELALDAKRAQATDGATNAARSQPMAYPAQQPRPANHAVPERDAALPPEPNTDEARGRANLQQGVSEPATAEPQRQAALVLAAQQALQAVQTDDAPQTAGADDIMAVELAGGMQIITPTQPPNDASLAAFAAAQGMSPAAVALLMGQPAGAATTGGGLQGQTTAQWMTPGADALTPQTALALKAAIEAMGQGGANQDAAVQDDATLLKPGAGGQAVTAPALSAVGGQALALAQQQLTQQLTQQQMTQAMATGAAPGSAMADKLAGLTPSNASAQLAAQVSAQLLASGLKGGALVGVGASAHAAAAQAMALAGVTEDDIQGLLSSRTGADVLGGDGAGGLTALDKLTGASAVPRSMQPLGVPLQAPGALMAQRNELYQSIAHRMGEAMGARIASQIAKGQWSMQLTLKPANLGTVDVDLHMRNGELEAKFAASNALTRDLLQDSLPKLRDALNQAGTNIASVLVNGGNSHKNHGNPTPQQGQSGSGTPLAGAKAVENDGLSSAAAAQVTGLNGDGPLSIWA